MCIGDAGWERREVFAMVVRERTKGDHSLRETIRAALQMTGMFAFMTR